MTARSFKEMPGKHHDLLRAAGCEIIWNPHDRPLQEAEMIPLARDVDAAIVGNDQVTAAVIAAAERLRIISKHGVGVDNIDLAAAHERGVIVANAPGTNELAVAELAIALMMALVRRLPLVDRITRGGGWQRGLGQEVTGKTLGVVGTGRIGREVARRAWGLCMAVIAYDVAPDEALAEATGFRYVALEELLKQADIVSLHVPLMAETRHLLDGRRLSLLKRGAYVINTARGGLIDEEALYRALVEGHIAGAAIDTFAQEPPADSPLLTLDNVIATSHIGAYTQEAIQRMGLLAARNVVNLLSGTGPVHRVG